MPKPLGTRKYILVYNSGEAVTVGTLAEIQERLNKDMNDGTIPTHEDSVQVFELARELLVEYRTKVRVITRLSGKEKP
jgi:hypothetical protein